MAGYHLPFLDGMRGVGIIMVISYHLGYTQVRHAWLCISSFFSMSGLLITGITVESFERRGNIDVLGFWSRRVARLFPALFLALMFCSVSRFFRAEDNEMQLWYEWSDLMWALGYLTNVNLVFFRKDDYFAATLKPSITRHLWTLSIEEQYYFMWPLLFVLWTRAVFWFVNISSTPKTPLNEPLLDVESEASKDGGKNGNKPDEGEAVSASRLNTCLKALVVGDCIVIALSYFSSLWTIEELGLSAAYYSTWCRAGDFACGGLVYLLVKLNPSIYRRYSRQRGLSIMSTPYRMLLEAGSAFALAMRLLPPMIQAPLQDALYGYFYYFRIPFGFFSMAATVPAALQLSEPLPKWAVVTRFISSKFMTKLGISSYGIYLIHWPLILLLGDPVKHESMDQAFPGADGIGHYEDAPGTVSGAFAGLPWSYRGLRDLGIILFSVGLGTASFLLYEKPLLVYVRHVKRPWKVLAAGLVGTLVTGVFVSACYLGVPNPNLANRNDVDAVYANLPAQATHSVAKDERVDAVYANLPAKANHPVVNDERFTPVWFFAGPLKRSETKMASILDEKTAPAVRPRFLPGLNDFPTSRNARKVMHVLDSTQPAGSVVIMCDTWLQLSPCQHGHWKEGFTWIWLSSPALCGEMREDVNDEGQPTRTGHGILQRCPDQLRIAALRMEDVRHIGESKLQQQSYTGSPLLDISYLTRMLVQVDQVAPGAINLESQARLKGLLAQHEQAYAKRLRRQQPSALEARDSGSELKMLMLGESVGNKMGSIFKDLLDISSDCQRGMRKTVDFPEVELVNLAENASPLVFFFLECRDGLVDDHKNMKTGRFTRSLPVCAPRLAKIKEQKMMSLTLTKPDMVVIHDSHWASGHGGIFSEELRFEAMSSFLSNAVENSVTTVFWMTPSNVGNKANLAVQELDVLERYIDAKRCRSHQRGVEFFVVDWHRLTCPTFKRDDATAYCHHQAHGFHNILPDGTHPTGPSGMWLAAQTLSAIMAGKAASTWGNSAWDEAIRNPISACLLEDHAPDGDPPLKDLIRSYRICP